MTRSFYLTLLLFLSVCAQISAQSQPPNVVLVYIDDMGYGDLGITGAVGYQTPNMDQMAREGMFFSQYYAPQAVCTASRAGVMTGAYPNRVGLSGALNHTAKIGLHPDEETIADILHARGYATAAYGKWHLGHLPEFLPRKQGFDEFYGIPYSNDMWPNHPTSKNFYPELPMIENETVVELNPDQRQFTTVFTKKSLDFIDRNKGNSFFLYLAHPMPHVPLFVSDKFEGKSEQGLYGDVIMELDWSIGEIRNKLKELNLEENTLVIVTSDNGPWLNYGNHAGSTGGLREGKGTSFEGGQRVPALMSWKGQIPEGTVCNNLASSIDLLPTIAALTGATPPAKQIDGVDISALLQGDFSQHPRESFLYYYRGNSLEAVRKSNWKLVFPHPGRTYEGFSPGKDGQPGVAYENHYFEGGLYDLRRDPGERYNMRGYYPEVEAELLEIATAAREDLGDDLTKSPGKNRREPGRMAE
uniref:sulfatase family protein n=1 Tax=Lunatibacter salilacus TaxID=2483804 RepID=UPI00131EC17F